MKLGDNMPIWTREKRAPTRAELAARHFADGGGMGTSRPGNSLPDDEPASETELVEVGDTGAFIRIAKESPATKIAVKRYNV